MDDDSEVMDALKAQSQDVESRLRTLEEGLMMLLFLSATGKPKLADEKAKIADQTEDLGRRIMFTVDNYPSPVGA